jgi:hypothetical protein
MIENLQDQLLAWKQIASMLNSNDLTVQAKGRDMYIEQTEKEQNLEAFEWKQIATNLYENDICKCSHGYYCMCKKYNARKAYEDKMAK